MDHNNVSQILTILYKLGHDSVVEFLQHFTPPSSLPQYVNKGRETDEVCCYSLSEETLLSSEYLH